MAASDDNETGFDSKRRLCPDGGCIGVIGSDGKCTVCGTPDDGVASPSVVDRDRDDDQEPADEDGQAMENATGASGFDPNRRLCSDDGCIGVIGEDNRCSECGKPAGD